MNQPSQESPTRSVLRLSPPQQMTWRQMQTFGPSAFFSRLRLEGAFDTDAMVTAVRTVLNRFETPRTRYQPVPAMKWPRGVIQDQAELTIHRVNDLPDDGETWSGDGVMVLTVIENSHTHAVVELKLSPMSADTRTLLRLAEDILDVLSGKDRGDQPEAVPYSLAGEWMHHLLDDEEEAEGRAFWHRHAPNYRRVSLLPSFGEAQSGFGPAFRHLPLAPSFRAALKRLAAEIGLSENAVLLATWASLLAYQLNFQPVPDGDAFPVAVRAPGRSDEALEQAVGLYEKYLPVGMTVDPSRPFRQLARDLDGWLQEAASWQECYLGPAGDEAVAAAYGFEPIIKLPCRNTAAGTIRVTDAARVGEAFQLRIGLVDFGDSYSLRIGWNAALEDTDWLDALPAWLGAGLARLAESPDLPIGNLSFLDDASRHSLVHDYAANPAMDRRGQAVCRDLISAWAAQVDAVPDRIAATTGDQHLSFSAMERRAGQWSARLADRGVRLGQSVAITAHRDLETLAAIYGILRIGAVYVPIHRTWTEQTGRILADLNPAGLIGTFDEPPEVTILLPFIDKPDHQAMTRPRTILDGSMSAYLLFTTGTTGTPRGCMIRHDAVLNLLHGLDQRLALPSLSANKVAVNGPFTFDTSIKQLFQPMLGRTLDLFPAAWRIDGEAFLNGLAERRPDTVDLTPSQLQILLEAGLNRLPNPPACLFLLGGEDVPAKVWRLLNGNGRLRAANLYGPTECTVDTTAVHITSEQPYANLGRPLPGMQVYVTDAGLRLVLPGMLGELCIAGAGLAMGYAAAAAETALHFVPDPFGDTAGGRLYRSGDRVRFDQQRRLIYLGRLRGMVKLLGRRVEPEAIRAAMLRHPDVNHAAIRVLPRGDGSVRLAAFVTATPEKARRVGNIERVILPNRLAVAHLNRNETLFLYDEMFEKNAYNRHGIHLRSGDTVVDAGANIGMFSLWAWRQTGQLRIFAFEPNPEVYARLALNVKRPGLEASCFNLGLSDRAGRANFTVYPGFSILSGLHADQGAEQAVVASYIARQQQNDAATGQVSDAVRQDLEALVAERLQAREIDVPLTTLSRLIDEQGIERIDLLKINAEKAEWEILQGIKAEHWPRIRQISLEIHDLNGRLASIRDQLTELGFTVAVERDWSLEDDAGTNYYLYAHRKEAGAGSTTPVNLEPSQVQDEPPFLEEAALRQWLRDQLPDYMMPADIVVMERMPTNHHGKVDIQALPDPESLRRDAFTAPRNPWEQKVATVWQDLLNQQAVDVNRSFFEVGGDSLLLVRVRGQLRDRFGIDLPVVELFQYPTVAGLAAKLAELTGDAGVAAGTDDDGSGQARRERADRRRQATGRRAPRRRPSSDSR